MIKKLFLFTFVFGCIFIGTGWAAEGQECNQDPGVESELRSLHFQMVLSADFRQEVFKVLSRMFYKVDAFPQIGEIKPQAINNLVSLIQSFVQKNKKAAMVFSDEKLQAFMKKAADDILSDFLNSTGRESNYLPLMELYIMLDWKPY